MSIDITLTPYDLLRLKRRLEMSSKEFVARYSILSQTPLRGGAGRASKSADC